MTTKNSNPKPKTQQLAVRRLGLADYDTVWALQKELARQRISGELAHDTLLLVQHPPIVTLGRSTKYEHLLSAPEYLAANGILLRDVERGGDVTVHEPGQLVAYPIFDLKQHKKDLHWYLRQIEESVIGAIAEFGIAGTRSIGQTGVWIANRKIASIGVHARDWVTWHGVALNVNNTLATFDHIVPCGIEHVVMTTVARECAAVGRDAPTIDEVADSLAFAVAAVFGLRLARCND